jgi:AcrR family transcriptional regulator
MSSDRRQRTRTLDVLSSAKRGGETRGGDPLTRRRILDAALELFVQRGGADVSLADVARAAHVSRQALYLHFADRSALFLALVRHADDRRGLASAIQRVEDAPTGVAAVREMVALQARMNPKIWPLARMLDAVRRQDEAAERSWQDRLQSRLTGCRRIVARLAREGTLRRGLQPAVAADLLWALTSLRTWEDLVLQRHWSPGQYEQRLCDVLLAILTA